MNEQKLKNELTQMVQQIQQLNLQKSALDKQIKDI